MVLFIVVRCVVVCVGGVIVVVVCCEFDLCELLVVRALIFAYSFISTSFLAHVKLPIITSAGTGRVSKMRSTY